MAGLEAKNLRVSYGGRNVVDNAAFAFGAGETWAVVGRNGAGKSTLLKCLCGLQKHHGDVLINGVPIAKLSPREIALQIAYVPQGSNRPAPPFTVREYVAMARFPYGGFGFILSADDKNSVDAALALTDTERLANRAMDTLSGGEFQAALIAGAAAQETPFLLLDEPTTHLDPCHQENVRMMIERVHERRGTTVVTVTHDVNFALSTHNNILALIDGRVFFRGTKEEFCGDAENNLSQIFSVDFCAVERHDNKTSYYVRGAL